MPFKSKAQRRKFYAMANRGEISHKKVEEWESATHGKKLPERVKKAVEAVAIKMTAPSSAIIPGSTVGAPTLSKLKGSAMRKMGTYDYGVKTALYDIGFIKEAKGEVLVPAGAGFFGPVGGAVAGGLSAPEGQGWRGAGGAALGSSLGLLGGSLGGRVVGGLTGRGIAHLIDADPELGAYFGRLLGAAGGAAGGSALGGHYGFRAAIDEDKKKKKSKKD